MTGHWDGLADRGGDRATAVAAAAWAEVRTFVPAVVGLLRGVATDSRVPSRAKLQAAGALAYLLSPLDAVVRLIPIVGQVDDAAVIAFAISRLLDSTDEAVLREHWSGSPGGLTALLRLARVVSAPRGLGRRLAVLGGAVALARDTLNGGGLRGRGHGKVIDGEVVR